MRIDADAGKRELGHVRAIDQDGGRRSKAGVASTPDNTRFSPG
jgi:hypothetical protein